MANWQQILSEYKHYLKLEKSLSDNTVESYLNDVRKWAGFLQKPEGESPSLEDITPDTVKEFIYAVSTYLSPRSQARIISGLRSFFSFLVMEGYLNSNPADWLDSPKLSRKIPEVLSPEELDRIFEAIDLSAYEGERNKAILEMMYACGLRVSEVTGLKLGDLYFEEGFVRVLGKGGKHRFVPMESYTKRILKNYLEWVRPQVKPLKGYENYVFLNRRGKALTRHMIFIIVKDLAAKAGIKKISARIRSGTVLPRICWITGPICEAFNCYWGMRISLLRRFICIQPVNKSKKLWKNIIRAGKN
jgi:integrase/recombinase XerD